MSRITGFNQIISSLRKQIDPLSRKPKATHDKRTQNQQTEPSVSVSPSITQLEQRIIERIKAVNDNDKNPKHKAIYILIESILAWEFGEHMLKDSGFSEIITQVNNAIESDTSLNEKINQLINEMINK